MTSSNNKQLEWAHPLVRDWFLAAFGSATEPQIEGWPHILAGRTTLISAPTGSGKTLAAFLACIDRLVRKAIAGNLVNRTEVVYVSPLKALSNDIHKNLEKPLSEIYQLAQKRGIVMPEIKVAVRTGDTLAIERQAMLKKPPHILVTTPESLYILLTAEKSRNNLRHVETVIVDEIHAVADDKRGAHLALSLERLDALTVKKPNRIGLSATQKPIELVAHFLSGSSSKLPALINVGHKRKLDLAVCVPDLPLSAVATHEMWENVYDHIAALSQQHRSTLVFVNTRKHAERVALHLREKLGEEAVAAHHGSLSRKIRLDAERKLKNGELKVLVATASLELGIDIGTVDLVCQINSPRSIAAGLQRIGRAGHWRGAIPKGRFFAMTRDDLVELSALVRAIKQGDLDRLVIPPCPMDVLAQQIVAMCAAEEWHEDELYALVKRAYPYRDLRRKQFDDILVMLADGISARRGRYGTHLLRDQVHKRLKGRRGARLAAITSGGAIPESNVYTVLAEPEETTIGTLDEDFAMESNRGDIILLGNTSWRVRRVENAAGRVLVDDAHGAPPTVPFWLGEAPARTVELSDHICELRRIVSEMTTNVQADLNFATHPQSQEAVAWLQSECALDQFGAEQIVDYIIQGRAILGAVPTKSLIIAERFFDEGGGMQLIIHSPYGGRINKAWGMALRKTFCRSFNFELQAAATDNGLNISLGEQHSFPLADVFHYLTADGIDHVLEQAALASPLFGTRWRWDAVRSLALLRFMGGKKVPPYIQRMRSDDLLAAVFPAAAACQDNQIGDIELPDHPLINEVMKDVLDEAMDLQGLKQILTNIANGTVQCLAVDTPTPSTFSHEILNANPYAYLDDAPLEERRARAVEMRRILPAQVAQEIGLLDTAAINQIVEESWPDIRDADELHDFMQTVVVLPEQLPGFKQDSPIKSWQHYFSELAFQHRASFASAQGINLWVCAERAKEFKAAYPTAQLQAPLPELARLNVEEEQAIRLIVQGWMSILGPLNSTNLAHLLKLSPRAIEIALLQLESEGSVLRGQFTNQFLQKPGEMNGRGENGGDVASEAKATGQSHIQFCDRRLLARIHRLTLSSLRKQIEAVSPALFFKWLAHWQHVAPGTQLKGERGTLEIIHQLQGFEVPANAWERQVLSKRVADYDPKFLDRLCLTGAIGWGRISRHPAMVASTDAADTGNGGSRRIMPTSIAPITFFVREDAEWLAAHHSADASALRLSHSGRTVKDFLQQHGASFFADIVIGTGLLKADIETALWELVTAGIVTADGFDNLRALIDPRRRAGHGRARTIRPRHSTGRWSLLRTVNIADQDKIVEATCKMLLTRYGVVFRDLLLRESVTPRWRELLHGFRLLESRGEIRGGRFVSGFLGEQFALPEALESLRAMRNRKLVDQAANGDNLLLSATDPLNLIGIIIPGDKVAAVSGKFVLLPN